MEEFLEPEVRLRASAGEQRQQQGAPQQQQMQQQMHSVALVMWCYAAHHGALRPALPQPQPGAPLLRPLQRVLQVRAWRLRRTGRLTASSCDQGAGRCTRLRVLDARRWPCTRLRRCAHERGEEHPRCAAWWRAAGVRGGRLGAAGRSSGGPGVAREMGAGSRGGSERGPSIGASASDRVLSIVALCRCVFYQRAYQSLCPSEWVSACEEGACCRVCALWRWLAQHVPTLMAC